MPYKDPELAAACKRRWAYKNRERELARTRARTNSGEWKSESKKKRDSDYRDSNRGIVRARISAAYFKRKAADPFYNRKKQIKALYGITIEQRDAMFAKHDGKCWICLRRTASAIDHDHQSGKIRGALCLQCNSGIGHLQEDTGVMLRAIRYLQSHQPEPTEVLN